MGNYDIAAYIWPAYTGNDPRAKIFWPEGYGEWESIKTSSAKYKSHLWQRKPLWGYVNEADPYVMEMQIEAAVDHGVNVFIYDWYWYDRRPFLEKCLNDGFLKARNRNKMKFYIMWANHNATYVWDKRISSYDCQTAIWDGAVDRGEFEKIAKRMINMYFKQPNYYLIDGKPVIMIYDVPKFVKSIGGLSEAINAIEWFKEEVTCEGFPGLHLQMVMKSFLNLACLVSPSDIDTNVYDLITKLGFDSITHYQFAHFMDIDREYYEILKDVTREWKRIEQKIKVPYFPHISLGWDKNPRFQAFHPGVMRGNTPEAIEEGLRMAKEYADAHPDQPKLITINSWNEWSETSYLQPDDLYGYEYLERVKKVFTSEVSK